MKAAPAGDSAPRVVFLDPGDGTTGVFRDAAVALCLSDPIDRGSLSQDTLSICDPEGPVPGRTHVSSDGRLLVWRPARPLRADTLHFVVAAGLRDARGRPVERMWSRFVPCGFGGEELWAATPREPEPMC